MGKMKTHTPRMGEFERRWWLVDATDRPLAKAERAIEVMERSENDADSFAAGDDTFHLALAECTRNTMLVWITERVSELRNNAEWSRMRQITLSRTMIRRYNVQHRSILEAVRARDAEQAARAMRAHLELARKSLVDAASS